MTKQAVPGPAELDTGDFEEVTRSSYTDPLQLSASFNVRLLNWVPTGPLTWLYPCASVDSLRSSTPLRTPTAMFWERTNGVRNNRLDLTGRLQTLQTL